MPDQYKARPDEKSGLHPRNKHRFRYDFEQLIQSCVGLARYVSPNQYQDLSIDFSDPDAVKMLNRALLTHYYHIVNWDIPAGYLCPPIPGRADYIHYLADLLASCNNNVIPIGNKIKALDIGVGANCVYPLIGHREYGWSFVGADVDPVAIRSAKKILTANAHLAEKIELRLQTNAADIYTGIIKPGEIFDVTICNPPFHTSLQEAAQGTRRKLNNLGKPASQKPVLNFGGQNAELWYPGGEEAFVRRMVEQSAQMPRQCLWYTTLISKKDNLPAIYRVLKRVGAFDVRTINMAQGQKVSRIVSWTFFNEQQQHDWALKRWKLS
ncbi:23S rRNA (adenine(1618)-N(6))-methyltransferase RlmF [Mucilaginibacter paludis]|uniref:Ribosomal RNA large subunit methyltransferase F n=1 Tax=Mucilaginibacter paludis DSM 18603 TaxID=714943 RepID=H1Y804_9SPHI|nr:23S rRNA (adenine(1618)-N(6))-methyltransferase RlmF [Mucilaginibacter paludis]EHQ30490.1 Ribosomal RNA large subunit methyltransferase F [Mucilaginibacter paludis DSM 18603]